MENSLYRKETGVPEEKPSKHKRDQQRELFHMKCHAPDLVSVVRGVPDALTAFATRASKPVHFPSKMAAIILNETHVTIPTHANSICIGHSFGDHGYGCFGLIYTLIINETLPDGTPLTSYELLLPRLCLQLYE